MGRKRDRFWEYAYEVDGRFKCKFCERDFAGGASRIKSHLAGVKGHDIDICVKVPKDIKEDANLAIGGPNKALKTASSSTNGKESKTFSISLSTITNGSSKKTTKEKNVTQWKEEYMAETLISVFVEGLLPKLESLAAERISYKWGIREELMKLLISLTKIQVVLYYVEKRQVHDEAVMKCLAELRDIADAVDDLLDEFAYMALQQKVQTRDQMKKKRCLTKLKSLYIKCCPKLEESYAKGSSAEWSKIAQIWTIKIVFLIHEERKAEWSKIPQIGTIKIDFLKHEEFEDRHYEDK